MSSGMPDFAALKTRYDSEGFSNGDRATLRRTSEPEDVTLTPAFYKLFPGQKPDNRHRYVAFLLPCAKHSSKSKSLSIQLVEAKIAESRVLQVARSDPPSDIVQLRRLLIQIQPTLDWSKFGRMIWDWDKKEIKRQFIEDFYIELFKGDKK